MTIRSMGKLKLAGIMLAILIAAAACTSGASNKQDSAATDNTVATIAPTATTTSPVVSSDESAEEHDDSDGHHETSEMSAIVEGEAAVEQATGALFLQMLSPSTDELFVTESAYEFTGRTTVDALLSVNDSVLEVDEEGRFAFAMELEEGPNVIEVVVSNALGDQFDEVLLVIYEPA